VRALRLPTLSHFLCGQPFWMKVVSSMLSVGIDAFVEGIDAFADGRRMTLLISIGWKWRWPSQTIVPMCSCADQRSDAIRFPPSRSSFRWEER